MVKLLLGGRDNVWNVCFFLLVFNQRLEDYMVLKMRVEGLWIWIWVIDMLWVRFNFVDLEDVLRFFSSYGDYYGYKCSRWEEVLYFWLREGYLI